MAIAAFVISIMSALAAFGSAIYARQQARAAREQTTATEATLAIERARRADEKTPAFSPDIVLARDASFDLIGVRFADASLWRLAQ